MTAHVITANDLKDGLVVYQSADAGWTRFIQSAEVLADEEALVAGLEQGNRAQDNNIVVGVYEIEIEMAGDEICPTRYRERLRALGPSTHPGFSRQSERAEAR